MARLSIATWKNANQVGQGVPNQTLSVTVTGSSAESSAITGPPGHTMYVRLCADAAIDYKVGAATQTAVAGTDVHLPANVVEVIGVLVGHVIAAVTHA